MTQRVTEADLAVNAVVWIKRRRCTIVQVHSVTGLRIFRRNGSDKEYSLTRQELQILVRKWDLVPDRIHQELPAAVREVISTEWTFFDAELRESAEARAAVCRALDFYGPEGRRKEGNIVAAIAKVTEALGADVKFPSLQRIRRHWDPLWIASLKDPRSQLDLVHLKGNRRLADRDGYGAVIDLVEGLITEFITSRVNKKESLGTVQQLADDLVSIAADGLPWREIPFMQQLRVDLGDADFDRHPIPQALDKLARNPDWSLHPLVDKEVRSVGANLVRDRFARRNVYDRMAYKTNRKEARRWASGIAEGPKADLPLQRVEGDSTIVDELVVVVDRKPKRMEITLLKDKCSGAVTGMHYSFESANWFTMHEAIRMSALPKADYLASFNYRFVNDWPTAGIPDAIVLDRHSTHRGAALAGMATKLGFEIMDMPAASGNLKGGVEKSLGDFMRQHVVSQPGYVGSNTQMRDRDRSVPECTEEQAVEGALAYIVDYYNQQVEPNTGEIRIHRFKRLMDQALAWKLPPDPSLFPGKPETATLTVRGVKVGTLTYRSPALLKMFFDAGGNADVVVFVPKYAPDIVYVAELRGAGHVEGYLQGEFSGLGLSHDAAAARARAKRRLKATSVQQKSARNGRVNQAISNDVRRGKPKRARPVTKPLSKAGDNLAVPKVDRAVSSSGEFQGHDMNVRHEFETLGKRGGAFATPGPGSRAMAAAIAQTNPDENIPALPVTQEFLPAVPNPDVRVPMIAQLASPNTGSQSDRGADAPAETLPSLPPMQRTFKI